jgi:hypothetical protein
MLTTIDNPYDPWLEYESWLIFDRQQGYNTNELLASKCLLINDLNEEEQDLEIQDAMNTIVQSSLFPFHIIVKEGEFKFNRDAYQKQLIALNVAS